jgi:hypothetical protein
MVKGGAGILSAGLRLVWQRQRVLWWVYAINFLLALMGTLPVAIRLGSVLDRSLAAERLYRGFDVGALIELLSQPDVLSAVRVGLPASLFLAIVYFVFMLFLTGGVLEVYRCNRTLTTGEFFQACGAFFWRFVRLLVFLVIVLVPLALLWGRVQSWSGRLASDAPQEMLGFWVQVGGLIITVFLLMTVRLWFDMAQVQAVAEGESRMRRIVFRAFKLTAGNFRQLFWIYFRISLVAWIGLALAVWVWVRLVQPEWVAASFLLGQAVLLLWLAVRLWLRASETAWFQRHGLALSPDYLERLVA